MKSLRKYVRKKKLKVNVEKTEMMVSNKRKRKSEENEWNWEERKLEQINVSEYLVYTFNDRATDEAHMRELVRKANKVVGCVWGVGEGKWMIMFESILMYGTEIWG
jgi:spore germination protein GerM